MSFTANGLLCNIINLDILKNANITVSPGELDDIADRI